MRLRIGIKVKLSAILAVLGFLTTIIMGSVMIAHQRASLEAQLRSMAGTITDEFSNDVKIPFMQKDSLAMNLLVENILKYPGIHDVYVLNNELVVEGHIHLDEVGKPYKGNRESILNAEGPPPWLLSDEGGIITFGAPIVFKDTNVGYAIISFSDSFIKDRVQGAIKSAVIITIAAIVVVSIVAIPISTGLLRPVVRLFKGTKEIAMGNFDYRIPEKSDDEMGDLVRSFNNMAVELKKKELMKGIFGRYVSSDVADEILKDPESVRLGGDRREVTVFFSDIRGFTPLSRKIQPEETVELLNWYFTLVTEIIFRFNGTVDKFIGDAVMSVFGAPIRTERHLEYGIKASVAIKKAIAAVNERRRRNGLIPLQLGLGIDSGEVIVGNMGSQMRMEYTAIGEAVNMASRLADLAKGGEILVSQQVYNKVGDRVVADRIQGVSIKGLDTEAVVYNIRDLKGPWREEADLTVSRMINLMEKAGVV